MFVRCETHGATPHRMVDECKYPHEAGHDGPEPSMTATETLDPREAIPGNVRIDIVGPAFAGYSDDDLARTLADTEEQEIGAPIIYLHILAAAREALTAEIARRARVTR